MLGIPPKGLFQTFMSIQDEPVPITVAAVSRHTPSMGSAKVFLLRAEKEGLLMRGRWGEYYPVSPRVALLSALVPLYHRRLWRTHDTLSRAGIPHAFACLTTASEADYVPARPITAIIASRLQDLGRSGVFGLMMEEVVLRKHTHAVVFEWPDGEPAFAMDELDTIWTALLLGAIGLPREVAAAKRLLKGRRIRDRASVRRLNAYGLSHDRSEIESEASIVVPEDYLELRAMYAESLRLSEVMGL